MQLLCVWSRISSQTLIFMRQVFAILLAFVSLLSSQGSLALAACGPQVSAQERCACCVTRPACHCEATPTQAPRPVPLHQDARTELPLCPCVPLAAGDNALVSPPPADRLAALARLTPIHTWRHVPRFILHCSALC